MGEKECACGMHKTEHRDIQSLSGKIMKEITRLEDTGANGRMTIKYILKEIKEKCVEWTYLAQDRDR